MRNIAIFSGSSHPELAKAICERLGVPLARCNLNKFSNKETNVEIKESVRDTEVYVIQSGCGNVNDNFMELLIMISACRIASAKKVTAVIPSFPYARQPDATFKKSAPYARVPLADIDRYSQLFNESSSSAAATSSSSDPNTTTTITGGASSKKLKKPTPANTGSLGNISTATADASSSSQQQQQQKLASDDHHPMSAVDIASPASGGAALTSAASTTDLSKSPRTTALLRDHFADSTSSFDLDRSSRRVSTISLAQPKLAVTTLVPLPTTASTAHHVTLLNQHVNNKSSYKHWTARSGTLIADMLVTAGADHIITMDLHDPQFQGFFDIPVDNLYSQPLLIKYIKEKIPNFRDAVIVSPDAGGAKRATVIADKLNMDFALIHKERRRHGPKSPEIQLQHQLQQQPTSSTANSPDTDMMLVGDVNNKVCILIDDIADTSYTISRAARLLHDSGATKIYALITHAIMSGDAIERVKMSYIDEVVVTNSVPQYEHLAKCKGKMKVIDIAPLFAEAIRRIHNGESVSFLFDEVAI